MFSVCSRCVAERPFEMTVLQWVTITSSSPSDDAAAAGWRLLDAEAVEAEAVTSSPLESPSDDAAAAGWRLLDAEAVEADAEV